MGKSIEAIIGLLEEVSANAWQWPFEHNTLKKTLRVHELDVLSTLSSQVTSLSKQLNSLTTKPI